MSESFTPCRHTLSAAQQWLWPQLAPTAKLGFTLYGGTAIALRLGHRHSVDFDFFMPRPLDREAIYAALPFMNQATVLQDERDTLTALTDAPGPETASVKLSFFGLPGFGNADAPATTDDGVMQVASLNDLMATKLKVILQRAEAKDYLDIAAMLDARVDLSHGLAVARAIYGPTFQPSESLKALTYYNDGDLDALDQATRRRLVEAAKSVRALPDVELAAPPSPV